MIDGDLENIFNDNISGSREILFKVHDYIFSNLSSINDKPELIRVLKEKLSCFEVIVKYLSFISYELASKGFITPDFLDDIIATEKLLPTIIAKRVSPLIKPHETILTFSNSFTVTETLLELNKTIEFYVIVSESRPMLEGRIIAQKLLDKQIKVEFITESFLPNAIARCNMVMIGADVLLPNGDVINKVGSKLLGILCKEFCKPLYVLSSRLKRSDESYFTQKFGTKKEVWNTDHRLLQINNPYLELLENHFISKIITD
ncbi:MAG: hypothetical protein KKA84_13055 [Bacteroidetes bacterium]|nr:hypothetical protein [Bacteroidota bacterium]